MNSRAPAEMQTQRQLKLLISWLLLCAALAIHVADEALNGFLAVYNPTVIAMRASIHWLPLPVFTFRLWITGLTIGILVLFALSVFVSRGARWTRPIAYVLALTMIANGVQHTIGTILGTTIAVRFPRPMPGFYSSPLLIAASIYLLMQLRKTAAQSSLAR
jgi:disulfide bond formation protein DsbB